MATKFIDLTGKKFGKLTVLNRVGTKGSRWLCKCECGRTKEVNGQNLRTGHTKGCGHCLKQHDLTGQRFGRQVAVKKAYITDKGTTYYECLCDCGNINIVPSSALIGGKSKSCGCLRNDVNRVLMAKTTYKHGHSGERLFSVWRSMKSRIYSPKSKAYKNYGGRGIKMCDEWTNSYEAFKEWAMANGYNPQAKRGDCTIDRIDVNGNYEPSNCRWVDLKVQANNKRSTHGTEIFSN